MSLEKKAWEPEIPHQTRTAEPLAFLSTQYSGWVPSSVSNYRIGSCYSKCGPQTRSSSSIYLWEKFRVSGPNRDLCGHNLYFPKTCRRFLCTWKFEESWCCIYCLSCHGHLEERRRRRHSHVYFTDRGRQDRALGSYLVGQEWNLEDDDSMPL